MNNELTDADRYPTLSERGRHMLGFLQQHSHAPVFRNHAGNRLTSDDLIRVNAFIAETVSAKIGWHPGKQPPWVTEFIARCYTDVPWYRVLGAVPQKLEDVRPTTRADLARDVALFVPDNVALDRLINFRTSGTTGHPLLIPSHPVVAASYLAFHKRALRRFGVELRAGRGSVGVALLGYQRQCFTYASVIPTMDEAGYVKLNLYPDDWRDADDRARYLNALKPEIFSGDPLSFAALLELPVTWKPQALVSTSMTLTPVLRARLEARFECPVLDVYSMSESGPIAVADPSAGGHMLLQHTLFVEILDEAGKLCAPGVRGEITLTGGFNFCLPLLRYRTGDYAALDFGGPEPVLTGLSGRLPVRFRAVDGTWVNSIDVNHALRDLPLRQFQLHQDASGAMQFDYDAEDVLDEAIAQRLHSLVGPLSSLTITRTRFEGTKVVQYASALTPS